MGNKDDETLTNLDDAFAAIAGMQSTPQEPSIFEQVSTIMPPPMEGEKPEERHSELSLTERILLDSKLLENTNPEIRKDAAITLAELTESEECTVINARRILDILSFRNKALDGELSPHVRRAKKSLGELATGRRETTEFERRDTLQYQPGARIAQSAEARQGSQKPIVDTTAKIRNTISKK